MTFNNVKTVSEAYLVVEQFGRFSEYAFGDAFSEARRFVNEFRSKGYTLTEICNMACNKRVLLNKIVDDQFNPFVSLWEYCQEIAENEFDSGNINEMEYKTFITDYFTDLLKTAIIAPKYIIVEE